MKNFFRIIFCIIVVFTVASVITVGVVGNYNDPSRNALVRFMSDYLAAAAGAVGLAGLIGSGILLASDKGGKGLPRSVDTALVVCFALMLVIHIAVWLFVIYQYYR